MNHSRIGSDTSNEDRFVKICHFISMESEIQDHRSAIFEILDHRLENGELMYLIVDEDEGEKWVHHSEVIDGLGQYWEMANRTIPDGIGASLSARSGARIIGSRKEGENMYYVVDVREMGEQHVFDSLVMRKYGSDALWEYFGDEMDNWGRKMSGM